METIIYIFAAIGFFAVALGWYYFLRDQYAIWEMNTYERLKKKFNK